MSNDFALDQVGFREWLASRPGRSVVGDSCDTEHCPLANWLASVYGGAWSVGPSAYGRPESTDLLPMPAWATSFVWEVDLASEHDAVPVDATEALSILDEL